MNKTIKIGPQIFKIVIVPNLRDTDDSLLDGHVHFCTSLIRLDAELDAFGLKHVLWHEIMHIIFAQSGHPNKEELIADAISYGVLSVLEDNPWLAK